MAMRTPCGKTFPDNFSIIPSSKKWVFHAIFHLAFLELYGDEVCSMNRLVLTDEEDAEYRSFESLIATNDRFKLSKVMLCIFHAIYGNHLNAIYILYVQKYQKRDNLLNCQKLVALGVSIIRAIIYDNSLQHYLSYIQFLLRSLSYLYMHRIPIPSLCLSNTSPV